MLERGGCNFRTKIKNAMNIGCTALIISDYETDKRGNQWGPRPKTPLDKENEGVLTVHIPTFEIAYQYA